MADLQAEVQADVQAAADEMVAAGTETGLQVVVLRHGRVLADVVSGVEDPETAKPVSPGTLFYAASTAKGVAASLAHVLAERGDITYDLRLADVWPEFAARGKEHTTLRHVLLHTAGLPGLPQETTVADLCDWDRVCAALAAAEPWWRPGTRFGYHALTFGFLLGETLRRVTGRTMGELKREVLTGPLGIADEVCFAVPRPLLPRVARQAASVADAGINGCAVNHAIAKNYVAFLVLRDRSHPAVDAIARCIRALLVKRIVTG